MKGLVLFSEHQTRHEEPGMKILFGAKRWATTSAIWHDRKTAQNILEIIDRNHHPALETLPDNIGIVVAPNYEHQKFTHLNIDVVRNLEDPSHKSINSLAGGAYNPFTSGVTRLPVKPEAISWERYVAQAFDVASALSLSLDDRIASKTVDRFPEASKLIAQALKTDPEIQEQFAKLKDVATLRFDNSVNLSNILNRKSGEDKIYAVLTPHSQFHQPVVLENPLTEIESMSFGGVKDFITRSLMQAHHFVPLLNVGPVSKS